MLSTIGVLLINLATPDAPTLPAVRRYLAQFLSDPRVVELPPCLWQIVLHLLVLPIRTRIAAHRYKLIWQPDGSPLRIYTIQQSQAVQQWLTARGWPVLVDYA